MPISFNFGVLGKNVYLTNNKSVGILNDILNSIKLFLIRFTSNNNLNTNIYEIFERKFLEVLSKKDYFDFSMDDTYYYIISNISDGLFEFFKTNENNIHYIPSFLFHFLYYKFVDIILSNKNLFDILFQVDNLDDNLNVNYIIDTIRNSLVEYFIDLIGENSFINHNNNNQNNNSENIMELFLLNIDGLYNQQYTDENNDNDNININNDVSDINYYRDIYDYILKYTFLNIFIYLRFLSKLKELVMDGYYYILYNSSNDIIRREAKDSIKVRLYSWFNEEFINEIKDYLNDKVINIIITIPYFLEYTKVKREENSILTYQTHNFLSFGRNLFELRRNMFLMNTTIPVYDYFYTAVYWLPPVMINSPITTGVFMGSNLYMYSMINVDCGRPFFGIPISSNHKLPIQILTYDNEFLRRNIDKVYQFLFIPIKISFKIKDVILKNVSIFNFNRGNNSIAYNIIDIDYEILEIEPLNENIKVSPILRYTEIIKDNEDFGKSILLKSLNELIRELRDTDLSSLSDALENEFQGLRRNLNLNSYNVIGINSVINTYYNNIFSSNTNLIDIYHNRVFMKHSEIYYSIFYPVELDINNISIRLNNILNIILNGDDNNDIQSNTCDLLKYIVSRLYKVMSIRKNVALYILIFLKYFPLVKFLSLIPIYLSILNQQDINNIITHTDSAIEVKVQSYVSVFYTFFNGIDNEILILNSDFNTNIDIIWNIFNSIEIGDDIYEIDLI